MRTFNFQVYCFQPGFLDDLQHGSGVTTAIYSEHERVDAIPAVTLAVSTRILRVCCDRNYRCISLGAGSLTPRFHVYIQVLPMVLLIRPMLWCLMKVTVTIIH